MKHRDTVIAWLLTSLLAIILLQFIMPFNWALLISIPVIWISAKFWSER